MRTGMLPLSLKASLFCAVAGIAPLAQAQDGAGFQITINGAPAAGGTGVARQVARVDAQLAEADLRIQYDGLTVRPVLDLEIADRGSDAVTVASEMNYPAFVTRGELRVYDAAGPGAPRLVGTQAIAPNGRAVLRVPTPDSYVVLRVYDARGRYDETAPLALGRAPVRRDGVEEGTDATVRRGIAVHGGAVTVSGSAVAPGAVVTTMGETVRPDGSGRFAIQRILPPGDHAVDVAVRGAGPAVDLVRDIAVPRSERFHVATIDLTYGVTDRSGEPRKTYTTGRVAGYLNARYANGVELTLQADTGEGPLDGLFSRLEDRDPRSVLLRVDPDDLYPTYGDDSTLTDDTPTSGRVFLRIERDNDYLQWGDDTAGVAGGYLRNERTLYGLTGHWQSGAVTAQGAPRVSGDFYAAVPERLPQRDIFAATGGSVYFLNRQDIGIGTETLTVQIRDASTGRVIETRKLSAGRDYQINYIQGVVTLAAPLSSYGPGRGPVVSAPGGDTTVRLVAAYEYTPTAADVDVLTYGGRVEGWLRDDLRLGVTAMSEETGIDQQTAIGVDLLWQRSENTFVALDYATSDGPGYTSSVSSDGGIIFDTATGPGGNGAAYRLDASVDLRDLGLARGGLFTGYYESREAGFNTLDYAVDTDETLWGVTLDLPVSARVGLALSYDDQTVDDGTFDREGTLALSYALSDRITLAGGLGLVDRDEGAAIDAETGSRLDAALRLTYAPDADTEFYGFVQGTLDRSGTLSENDRIGLGGRAALSPTWSAEADVSDGDLGPGARILFRQDRGDHDSTYFGYELDPDRDLSGVTLAGRDAGRFVIGGTRDLGHGLRAFGENTYDMFGSHRALTSAYGATYRASDVTTYTGTLEFAQVEDDVNGDYDRTAVSLGVAHQSEKITAQGRIEYRREDGSLSGSPRDSETFLVVSDLAYRIDDDRRILLGLDAARTKGNGGIVARGDLVDLRLGYALRPVDNERLNMLFRYRYLEDTYGQQLAGDDDPGALQRSHVLSAEASYDLNAAWTLGGKLGFRLSQTAEDAAAPWVRNNAALAVANARYHFLHKWDTLVELRAMRFEQTETTRLGALGAVYRQINPNVSIGVGYNFGTVSSDLTDIEYDEQGAFINLVSQF